MKKTLFFVVTMVLAITLRAQDKAYDRYYEGLPFKMNKVIQPSFPDNTENITAHGGVGDGLASNTAAFAKAIDALATKGGGKLVVSRGIWITGPIILKDNINLHLDAGALILFSDDLDEYPLIETNFEGWKAIKATSPITAKGAKNIAITGDGTIDGNGDAWRPVKKEKMTNNQWNQLLRSGGSVNAQGNMWFPTDGARDTYARVDGGGRPTELSQLTPAQQNANKAYYRPVMVSLIECRNILLQGVTFQNSPAWNVHPLMCENLTLDNVKIRNPWYSQNGDGLDAESCSGVLVVNSSFDVGDDAICVKSGKDQEGRDRGMPTKNMIIDNCIVYHGHGGFVIGSEMSGGVNNVWVRNCTFMGTDVGLRFKTTRGRGGLVENIWIENIDMTDIPTQAVLFDLYYGQRSATVPEVSEGTPQFRNIFMKNITCRGAATAMLFNGLPEMNVKNVSVENAVIRSNAGIVMNDSDGVTFKNVTVLPKQGPVLRINNSKNVDATGLKVAPGSQDPFVVEGSLTINVKLPK
ncbi:MAG: glycoside hydrolase family 28 protein [Rikenellaceae bacterium]|jgi:polygalacturonase|nr:glycoside hydrolase family 28 protein [Rikenellaceae bacterium]